MPGVRKYLILLVVSLLIFSFPSGTQARGFLKADSSIRTSLQAGMSYNGHSRQAVSGEKQDYHDPAVYPLRNSGHYAGSLVDSFGTRHDLTYQGITTSSSGTWSLKLGYQASSYFKESQLDVELYTNKSGSLSFVGAAGFDVGSSNNINLSINQIDPSFWKNDPYVYLRIGISPSVYSLYYSGTLTFKIVNPAYASSSPPVHLDQFLISNESPDGTNTEYTGSFKLTGQQRKNDGKLSRSAYKQDFVKPFDVSKNRGKLLTTRVETHSIKVKDQVGDQKLFWTYNMAAGSYEQIPATLLYSGTHGNVWVNNNQITSAEASLLGAEFDNKIYPSDVNNFGHESDVDGNGKVNILCYDIQDGFSGSGGYIAGYFDPNDLSSNSNSNQSEIFYIDTYPSMGMSGTHDLTDAKATLAHEFQHMISFNQNVLVEHHAQIDTWIDEGLSMAAEQIYSGQVLSDRIDYYNVDPSIAGGHSLLQWDYNYDPLANYSLSYLFLQYLKVQCNQGNTIFKEIINDPNSNYQAVQDVIHKYISSTLSFGKFMTDFREALYLNQSTGLFGFHGQSGFSAIKKITYNGSATFLQGGGAVVTPVNAAALPKDGGRDITYTDLTLAQDKTPPSAPKVNPVSDRDTTVTGTAEANASILIRTKSQTIGTGKTDGNGTYKISIKKQVAGTVLNVYATDAAGNRSSATTVSVADKTPPSKPAVYTFSDASYMINGKAEAYSKITIKYGKTTLGAATTSSKGTFSVKIKVRQPAGRTLTAYTTDRAGNTSSGTTFKVADKTAPPRPTVYTFGNNATTISGRAEANSKITIKYGKSTLGTATTSGRGTFSVKIRYKQPAGRTLIAYATDRSGNTSSGTTFKVVDRIAPGTPSVNKLTSRSTRATGKAERYAAVYAYLGNRYVGKAVVNSKSTFSMAIHRQKRGVKLTFFAKDHAGNKSGNRVVKVY